MAGLSYEERRGDAGVVSVDVTQHPARNKTCQDAGFFSYMCRPECESRSDVAYVAQSLRRLRFLTTSVVTHSSVIYVNHLTVFRQLVSCRIPGRCGQGRGGSGG